MSDRDGGSEFFAGFIIGGLVGAVLALVLAPQPGEQTRALIKERGIELKDRASDFSTEVIKKAEELSTEAKRRAEELSGEATRTVDEFAEKSKGAVKSALNEGMEVARKKKEDLSSQFDLGQGEGSQS
jgi:gas vesicle protein